MKSVVYSAAVGLTLLAATAGARPVIDLNSIPFGAAALRAALACGADARRLCPDTPRGGGKVLGCLAGKRAELSAPCAAEMGKADLIADSMINCEADVKRFCASVVPGGGRIISCLVANQDRVAAACYDGLAKGAKAYGGVVR
ncbi:MAG: cysteine rich repeat-containing protein [Neomegalonema sp.]|nr:cysteine rich repeat-containing protein [Neomegalonema sp.]